MMEEKSEEKRSEDATLVALNMEDEAISHGLQMASRSWVHRETCSPRASRNDAAPLTPVFWPSEIWVGLLTYRTGRSLC